MLPLNFTLCLMLQRKWRIFSASANLMLLKLNLTSHFVVRMRYWKEIMA